MRRLSRLAALAAAALALSGLLLMGGCGDATSPGGLHWRDCDAYECATVTVPLDYGAPAGATIDLALIRAPARDEDNRIGSLLINPGGPGASTIDHFSGLVDSLSADLRDRFDIVGFDPRGVGQSGAVTCVDDATMDMITATDLDPTTPAEKQQAVDQAREFAAGCQRRSGSELPFLDTESTARDMDGIRTAVGDAKLSYLGFSYGTFLGAMYATLFPGQVRALSLDGAMDPQLARLQSSAAQAAGFQKALEAFLGWCSSRSSCEFRAPGDLLDRYRRVMARIDENPLPTALQGRVLASGQAHTGVDQALYDQSDGWPVLARGLAQAENGDGTILLRLADHYNERSADGHYSNLSAANTAINCRDYAWPSDLATYESAANKAAVRAPDFGPEIVYGGMACASWPVRPGGHPAISAPSAPTSLVVGTTGDPATPYAEAKSLVGQLRSAVLLTRVGEGHTGYSASECVRSKTDAYLINGTVPPAGTVCDP
ncbi:MAG: alpha/beta hydrolase [Frankiaceae bacterium]